MAYAFKNRNASILQVPFHIGCRWEPADLFAEDLKYSAEPAVVHFKALNYRKGMNRMQFRPDSDFFFASVGLRL